MNRSPLPPIEDPSWDSLIEELADMQAFLFGPDEKDDRYLPGDPATEIEIATVETELRFGLPQQYREFLMAAGGWPHMHEDTHALSPGDLLDGPLFKRAMQVLSEQDDFVLNKYNIRLQDLLPIAVSESSLDLMCLITRGPRAGSVLWTLGAWEALYPSVRAWLEGLIEDTRSLSAELLGDERPAR